ncbi:MAG: hypothetical protein Kow00124_04860 [Anaerolineae bacterium]
MSSLKPTLETRFHIDTEWWERSGQDLMLAMRQICSEYAVDLPDQAADELIDWIDQTTGIVMQVSPFVYHFLRHCTTQEDYLTERTSLVEAVFRALLAAANRPMTSVELAQRIGRPAESILAALSGRQVYKGIRPYTPPEP